MRAFAPLIFNHADAWGSSLIICTLSVVLHDLASPRAALVIMTVTVCYWLGFALNDYFDAPYDAADPRKGARNYFVGAGDAGFLRVVAAVMCGTFIVFASFGLRGVALFVVAAVALWTYSAPPFRFKARPGFDLWMHALFVQTFPYVIPLILFEVAPTRADVVLVALFFLTSLSAQLEQQIRDYAIDVQHERTFTTAFGPEVAAGLLRALSLVIIAAALLNVIDGALPAALIPFGVIAAPIVLHRLVRGAYVPRSEALFRAVLAASLTALLVAGLLWGGVVSLSAAQ